MINSQQRPECQKYRLWKKAQQVKSTTASKKVKKKSKKGPLDDCLEDENNEEKEKAAPLQIDYQKCKERQKKRKRRALAALAKAVPILKQMEDRIQPPIALRDQWINARHYRCLLEENPSVDLAVVGKATSYAPAKKRARISTKSPEPEPRDSEKDDGKEDGRKDTTSKGSPSQQRITSGPSLASTIGSGGEAEDKAGKKKKKEKKLTIGSASQLQVTSGTSVTSTIASGGEVEEKADKKKKEKKLKAGSASQQRVTSEPSIAGTAASGGAVDEEAEKKKKKRKLKVVYPYVPQYTGESECESVCSFDSDICLAGMRVTSAEQKELQKYQERRQ